MNYVYKKHNLKYRCVNIISAAFHKTKIDKFNCKDMIKKKDRE